MTYLKDGHANGTLRGKVKLDHEGRIIEVGQCLNSFPLRGRKGNVRTTKHCNIRIRERLLKMGLTSELFHLRKIDKWLYLFRFLCNSDDETLKRHLFLKDRKTRKTKKLKSIELESMIRKEDGSIFYMHVDANLRFGEKSYAVGSHFYRMNSFFKNNETMKLLRINVEVPYLMVKEGLIKRPSSEK